MSFANKKSLVLNLTLAFTGGLFLGIVVALPFTSSEPLLESGSQAATIIAVIAVLVAILQFFRSKEMDRTLFVVEQLDFFRTKILDQNQSLVDHIRKDSRNSRTADQVESYRTRSIKSFDYYSIFTTYRKNILEQQGAYKDTEVRQKIINMLNALEQFSWSVILHRTSEEPALYVVHNTYIQLIEQFSNELLLMRVDGSKQYDGVKQLYLEWEPQIEREAYEEKFKRVMRETEKIPGKV